MAALYDSEYSYYVWFTCQKSSLVSKQLQKCYQEYRLGTNAFSTIYIWFNGHESLQQVQQGTKYDT